MAEYFSDSVFADIDSLALYGGIHQKVFGFHRLLAKRFPHAIYYRVEDGITVVVYRILDCRQDPAKTSRALRSAGTGIVRSIDANYDGVGIRQGQLRTRESKPVAGSIRNPCRAK